MAKIPSSRDIIVIGASSGGLEALSSIVAALPRDMPVSLFGVFHVFFHSKSFLPEILTRAGPLPATHPKGQ